MPDIIEELQIEIGAKAVKANDAIDRLIGKLDLLTTSLSKVDGASIRSLSNGVERLSGAMQTMGASVKMADFTRLARNLERIGSLDSSALNSVSNSIQSISNTLNSIGSVSANSQAVADMTKNIAKLGGKSVQTAIANMPQLANAVNNLMATLSKAPKVSQNIIDMTNALANLAAQGSKVGSSSRTLVSGLNKTRTAAERTAKSTASLASAFGKFYATWFMVIRGIKTVWKDIESSMDYIETSNYFNVALSQIGNQFEKAGYETAEAYTAALTERLNQLNTRLTGYTVGESGEALFSGNIGLGIDIEKMMNFQAKTLAVTNSVGLLGEASVETTKAISMLAGDLSSLTNLDIESVMTNLSSGLIGQSRSLYKYGIDITNNTLQQYALAEGLEKSVQEMTQAEKMQLRLIAILDQSKVSHADLANTINSVANQYRVFNQQVDNLGRTLGNLLLPIVKNVLPYVNGLVIALNNLFTTLGFKMYGDTWLKDLQDGISGGVQEGFEDTEDAIEDTTEALNKLKNGVRGFDVLNVISSSSKSGVNGDLENTIDLTEAITKAVENYEKSWNKAFETAGNKAQEIAEVLTEKFYGLSGAFDKLLPAIKGIGTALITYKIVSKLSGIIASLASLGSPVGYAALAAGVLLGVGTAIKQASDDAKEADLETRFGNISLSLEEIEEVAKYIVDRNNLSEVAEILSKINELDDIENGLNTTVKKINKMNWKVSIGMELTEEDEAEYKNAIASYVSSINNYVESQQYAANIGIRLFLQDSQTSEEVQTVVNDFYSNQSAKLKALGDELNQVTTDAWNDGLLTIDEVETITNIQNQMAEIQNQLSTSEFQAKLQILERKYSGSELTAESYKKLQEERQKLIDEYTDDLNESLVFTIAQINLAYETKIDEASTRKEKEKIKKEWDNALDEIYESRDLKISEMVLKSLSFDYNTIAETFGKELDNTYEGLIKKLSSFSNQLGNGTADFVFTDIAQLVDGMVKTFKKEATKAGAKNFGEVLDLLTPSEKLEETAESMYKTTGAIPQAMADALVSQYALESIDGSIESVFKLMLLTANSDDAQAVLDYMELLGIDIPEFLANGISSSSNLATDSLTKTLETLEKTIDGTNLIKSAENLGNNIGKALSKGIDGTGISDASLNLEKAGFLQLKFHAYALGGFPQAGQLFLANEAGPELVGTMNGKTAVASNGEITGIREAIVSASSQEISLLKRQNALLQGILEKEFGVTDTQIFNSVRRSDNNYYRRTGNSAFSH